MHVRLPFAILALAVAFAGGIGTSHLIEREARAQSAQSASVYVPSEGLAFRGVDGRLIARLSYDSRGGAFEVYDNHERPAGALRPAVASEPPRTSSALPVLPASGFPPPAATTPPAFVDLGY